MRWSVVLVMLLGVALIAADRGLASYAEARAEAEVVQRVGAEVDVELHGTLAGVRLLLGLVPLVTAEARDVELAGGLRLARLRAELREVRVGLDFSAPTARTAQFELELDGAGLTALMSLPEGLPAGLILEKDRLLLSLGDVALGVRLTARDGVLLVGPDIVPDTFGDLLPLRVDLRDRPGRPEIVSAEVRDHRVVLRGVLTALVR